VEAKGERGVFPAEQSLQELARLVTTAGCVVVGNTIQRVARFHPATLAGKGKLEELVALREELPYDTVVVDTELSPTQQRNLEETLKCKVLDRSALILDIFAQRAHTRDAQLQVELAQLEYLLPRLAGMFTFFSRSSGAVGGVSGIATRGPGETQLETDRRHIRQRIARLGSLHPDRAGETIAVGHRRLVATVAIAANLARQRVFCLHLQRLARRDPQTRFVMPAELIN